MSNECVRPPDETDDPISTFFPEVRLTLLRLGSDPNSFLSLCGDFPVLQRTITGVPMQLQRLHYTAALFQCIRH